MDVNVARPFGATPLPFTAISWWRSFTPAQKIWRPHRKASAADHEESYNSPQEQQIGYNR